MRDADGQILANKFIFPGKVETCGKGGLLPTILAALTMDIVAPLNKRPHPAPVYVMPMC